MFQIFKDMKKIFLAFLVCFINICSYAQVNVLKADASIKSYMLSKSGYADCWIFRYNSNTNIKLMYNEVITLSNNVFVYVVNRNPEQSWIDGYEYYFVNKNNGSISKQAYKYSPKTFENWTRIYGTDYTTSKKTFDFESSTAKAQQKIMMRANSSQSHKYAVIISGGANEANNHIRYWNNCSALYKVLKQYYGYKDADIYVLMSDGKSSSKDRNTSSKVHSPKLDSSPLDLDGDGVCDIDYAATKKDIANVFNQLSKKVTTNDNLFVFTTDHGVKKPYLCLWNEELMNDTEFAKEIDKVNAGYMSILMIQCYSGGFINKLAKKNRVIMTAASGNEPANSTLEYGMFFMPWIAAVSGVDINGKKVNADLDGDGKISMYEAFVYAKENDECAISGDEHPQYKSISLSLGEHLTLNGCDCKPKYIENRTISTNTTITGCDIELTNVTIKNNSSVTIDAEETTVINGPFEVELGATLEIK